MKLKEIAEKLNLEVKCCADCLDIEVNNGYVSDLLSDVLANSEENNLWITLQIHPNIVAIASMNNLAGIVVINGRELEEETVKKAEEEHKEYERIQKDINNLNMLKKRIITSKHEDKIKALLLKKYNDIQLIGKNDEEYYKEQAWIKKVLSLPTENKTILESIKNETIGYKLKHVKSVLDRKIYGQDKVKEQILQTVVPIINGNHGNKKCITFQGKPGVGKTELAKSLAEALELPFYQISLGGCTDTHYMTGHSPTYIGATCGIIAKALMQMKYKNGILFLDEFDKLQRYDIISIFLHILDYTQNNKFKDQYMSEIDIDLSQLIIVISVNDIDNVDAIVSNRMFPRLTFKDYSTNDKLNICKDYLIPIIENDIGFNKGNIKLDDEVLKYILKISGTFNTPGIRRLNSVLKNIYEKINVLKYKNKSMKLTYDIKGFKLPIKLTVDNVKTLCKNDMNDDNIGCMYI